MSEAPETLCAWAFWRGGSYFCRHNANDVEFDPTNYRRADLPLTTAQIMVDPRVVALVEAAKELQSHFIPFSTPEFQAERALTAALAQLKGPKP